MFNNLNFWEVGVLVLLALFIFGPERLPKVIGDGMRMLRNVRNMARNATTDLSRELGTDVRLEDLHPKTFIRKHLLTEEEERDLRRPFEDAYRDVRQDVRQAATDTNDYTRSTASPTTTGSHDIRDLRAPEKAQHAAPDDATAADPRRYDADAT